MNTKKRKDIITMSYSSHKDRGLKFNFEWFKHKDKDLNLRKNNNKAICCDQQPPIHQPQMLAPPQQQPIYQSMPTLHETTTYTTTTKNCPGPNPCQSVKNKCTQKTNCNYTFYYPTGGCNNNNNCYQPYFYYYYYYPTNNNCQQTSNCSQNTNQAVQYVYYDPNTGEILNNGNPDLVGEFYQAAREFLQGKLRTRSQSQNDLNQIVNHNVNNNTIYPSNELNSHHSKPNSSVYINIEDKPIIINDHSVRDNSVTTNNNYQRPTGANNLTVPDHMRRAMSSEDLYTHSSSGGAVNQGDFYYRPPNQETRPPPNGVGGAIGESTQMLQEMHSYSEINQKMSELHRAESSSSSDDDAWELEELKRLKLQRKQAKKEKKRLAAEAEARFAQLRNQQIQMQNGVHTTTTNTILRTTNMSNGTQAQSNMGNYDQHVQYRAS